MNNDIVKFIFEQLLKLLPIPKLPDALVAVMPLLKEFASSEIILNDDTRADLQLKIIRALRKAGLETYSS